MHPNPTCWSVISFVNIAQIQLPNLQGIVVLDYNVTQMLRFKCDMPIVMHMETVTRYLKSQAEYSNLVM